ncbi:MAG: dienelactone hydrolase family protein [Bacteroidota bacterium]
MRNYLLLFSLTFCLLACNSETPSSEQSKENEVEENTETTEPTKATLGKEVSYQTDTTIMKGYIASDPSKSGKRPGILVVHEWWGHNDYARKRAEMLAELGYVALAVDMYGDGKKAEHPDDAGKFAKMVMSNMDVAKARFSQAMETLRQHPDTDPEKIAAIGYCFGGGLVLNMAMQGVDVDGVVSFHGSLPTPAELDGAQVKAKMLVCHGAADQFIQASTIDQFKKLMADAKVDMQFESYEGAVHSFTNPDADENGQKFGLPLAYDQKADEASWQEMQQFFGKIFQ